MTVEAFMLQNFMGFEDSGWLELRPITLLFGRNSSGKSAILRVLLLLRQSLDSPPEKGPLLFVKDDGFDFGDFSEIVRGHRKDRAISFWFQCRLDDAEHDRWHAEDALRKLGADGPVVRSRLTYGRAPSEDRLTLRAVDVYDMSGNLVLQASAPSKRDSPKAAWAFSSSLFDPYDQPNPNLWPYLELFTSTGFLPWVRATEGSLGALEEDAPNADSAFGEKFHNFWRLLNGLRSSIDSFLMNLDYLSPLRDEPQRFYYVSGHATGLAAHGKHFVRNLLNAELAWVEKINDWLSHSGFKVRLDLKQLDDKKKLYELRLVDSEPKTGRGVSSNLREVGFGLSQVLPVIVQTMLAPEGSTVLIEQPELHLHPGRAGRVGGCAYPCSQRPARQTVG